MMGRGLNRVLATLLGSAALAAALWLVGTQQEQQPETLILALSVIGGVAGWYLLTRPPLHWLLHAFLFLIVLAAYLPFAMKVWGLNLRPSQVLLPVVLLRLLGSGAAARITPRALKLAAAGLLMWGSVLLWTLVNLNSNANPVVALGRVGLLGLNLLHAAAMYLLVVETGRWRQTVLAWAGWVAAFNTFLLLAGTELGRYLAPLEGYLAWEAAPVLVQGTLTGGTVRRFTVGVLTGNLSVAVVVLVLSWMLREGKRSSRRWEWLWLALATAGIVTGFSRQAVVGLGAGLGWLGLHMLRQGRLKRLGLLLMLTPVLGGLLWVLAQAPPTQPFFQALAGRAWLLLDAGAYRTGTAGERLKMWGQILGEVAENPLAGAGQDAYMVYYPSATGGGSHNFPVEVLHAGGLLALLAYLYLHGAIFRGAWRALRARQFAGPERWLLLGLSGALLVVWLSSLTNLIFWSQVYWLVLGLTEAGAGAAAAKRQQLVLVQVPEFIEAGMGNAHRLRHAG
jgi:O-antigen ligase